MPSVQIGDRWLLNEHMVYCENTSSDKFINFLPFEAALAIVIPSSAWNHDYIVDKAHVVAVVLEEGQIYDFCIRQHMPFRFEFLLGKLYVAVFSHQSLPKPRKPVEIEGKEGIIAYLVNRYRNWGNFVLAPFIGNGEILIICERAGLTCFTGDRNPHSIDRALVRWQNWTNKHARKI